MKIGSGEEELTYGRTFNAGHEPTQRNAFGVGHEPTQADPCDRRGASAYPAGPYVVDTAILNGLRLVDPSRSCSVAGAGTPARKSALPLALPLRYSSVFLNWMGNFSYRWTQALSVHALPMFSNALWLENLLNIFR